VVSVLAIGPKVWGFEPGQRDGFLRAIKICSTPSFGWEVKPEVPCHKILWHVKDLLKSHGADRLNCNFLCPLSRSLQRCLGWQDCQTVLVAARDVSADRTTSQYWELPEMSLLTRPPDSTDDCQSTLVDKFGVSLSQYHHTVAHIANHPGMNSRPVEAAVLRRQSHPIIASLTTTAFPTHYVFSRVQCSFLHHCFSRNFCTKHEIMLQDGTAPLFQYGNIF
jgi:hypothetical protein